MPHVKSCKVKHNSEGAFRYFASAVNSYYSTKCNRKDPLYTFRKSLFGIQRLPGLYITLHSPSAREDGIHPVQIHLIEDSEFT